MYISLIFDAMQMTPQYIYHWNQTKSNNFLWIGTTQIVEEHKYVFQ